MVFSFLFRKTLEAFTIFCWQYLLHPIFFLLTFEVDFNKLLVFYGLFNRAVRFKSKHLLIKMLVIEPVPRELELWNYLIVEGIPNKQKTPKISALSNLKKYVEIELKLYDKTGCSHMLWPFVYYYTILANIIDLRKCVNVISSRIQTK